MRAREHVFGARGRSAAVELLGQRPAAARVAQSRRGRPGAAPAPCTRAGGRAATAWMRSVEQRRGSARRRTPSTSSASVSSRVERRAARACGMAREHFERGARRAAARLARSATSSRRWRRALVRERRRARAATPRRRDRRRRPRSAAGALRLTRRATARARSAARLAPRRRRATAAQREPRRATIASAARRRLLAQLSNSAPNAPCARARPRSRPRAAPRAAARRSARATAKLLALRRSSPLGAQHRPRRAAWPRARTRRAGASGRGPPRPATSTPPPRPRSARAACAANAASALVAADQHRRRQVRLRHAGGFVARDAGDREQPLHHLERAARPQRRLEAEQRHDQRVERGGHVGDELRRRRGAASATPRAARAELARGVRRARRSARSTASRRANTDRCARRAPSDAATSGATNGGVPTT